MAKGFISAGDTDVLSKFTQRTGGGCDFDVEMDDDEPAIVISSLSGSNRRVFSIDEIGQVADVELVGRCRTNINIGDVLMGFAGRTNPEGVDFYAGTNRGNDIRVYRQLSGSLTELGSEGDRSSNNYWWTRFRINGSDIKVKRWDGGPGDEPPDWDIEVSDSSVTAAGWAGLFCNRSGRSYYWREVGWATDGDPAPTEPVDDDGVEINVPLSETVVEAFPPEIITAAGAEVEVPLSETVVEAFAPTIATGSAVDIPLSDTVVEAFPPEVIIVAGVQVNVPLSDTVVEAFAPEIATGVAVDVPLSDTVVEAFAPSINTGALVDVPLSDTVVEAFAPEIVIDDSTTIDVPLSETVVEVFAPEILAGAAVAVPLADTIMEALAPEIVVEIPEPPPPPPPKPPRIIERSNVARPLQSRIGRIG